MSGEQINQASETVDLHLAEETLKNAPKLVNELYNMPDNPKAVNPVQNDLMKEENIRFKVQLYALNRTGRTKELPTPMQISQYSTELLNDVIPKWAAANLGDKNGIFDDAKKTELKKHPSTQIIASMIRQLSSSTDDSMKVAENNSKQEDTAALKKIDNELMNA